MARLLYNQECGWDDRVEALVARIAADFIDHVDPTRERCWIAERDGQFLGCAFVVADESAQDTAKLRLVLVLPAARGTGLGRRLVREAVTFARGCKYRHMVLWTDGTLTAARRIYETEGFSLVRERSTGASVRSLWVNSGGWISNRPMTAQ